MSKSQKIEEMLNEKFRSRYRGLLTLSDLPLATVDVNGNLIAEGIPMPDFCKQVCQDEPGRICEHLRSFITEGVDDDCMKLPICKNGLHCLIAPIRDTDRTRAYLVGGFTYSPDTEYLKFILDLRELDKKHGRGTEFVAKTFAALQTVPIQKAEAHRQLCLYLAQSISRWLSGGAAEEQSIEKDLLERRIRELEAKDEPMSVNPNFLFNTLNCIARIAFFEKASETETLIYYLSDILRFNARTEFYLRNLQMEMEMIEKYLYIQKARFKTRLQYELDLPDYIKSCNIPNMVLLPIVENALVHGILLKREGGTVRITAESRDDKVVIFVIDNGQGFSQEKLKALKESDFTADDNSSLCLTNRRLKNYYGKDYGIDVVKSDFSGSTVSITIANSLFMG